MAKPQLILILKTLLAELHKFICKAEDKFRLELLIFHDVLANITEDSVILPEYNIELKDKVSESLKASGDLMVDWFLKIYRQPDDEKTLIYRYNLLNRILSDYIDDFDFIRVAALCLNKAPTFVSIPYGSDFSEWQAPVKIAVVRQNKGVMLKTLNLLMNREDVTEGRVRLDHAMFSSYALMLCLDMFDALVEYQRNIRKGLPSDKDFYQLTDVIRETIRRVRGVLTHA